jgi:hypothetical protein
MRRVPLAVLTVLIVCAVAGHAQNPPCDPDRDRRNPNLEQAKEAKKAELRRAGYPERFMKLIDQEQCIACVREASDAFHIMIVYNDNAYAPTDPKTGKRWTHISTGWDPESELIAREKTKDGTIKGYYISNTLKRDCKCCPEIDDNRQPEDYSDWNEDLQANTSHLIPFDQSNTTGPPPDDLIHPPPQWIDDPVPNIETFQKPPRKQVSAPCPQCAGEALALNDAYRAVDELWDEKIALMNEQSVLENAEATRRNDISLMRYRQRSALTRTPDGDRKIEEAERAQEADNITMRANAVDLELIEARLKVLMPRIEQMEKALIACAEKCKRPTVTEQPPTPPPAERAPAAVAPRQPVTGTTPDSPPSGANPPQPPGTPGAGSMPAACPNCQALANLLAALDARRHDVEDAIDWYQERIALAREQIAQQQRELDGMKAKAKATGTYIREAGQLENQIVENRSRIFQWQTEIDIETRLRDEVDQQIASIRERLRRCNESCSTADDTRITPPDGGIPVMCPACIAIAEALQQQLSRIEEFERELAGQRAEIRKLEAEFDAAAKGPGGLSGERALSIASRMEDVEATERRTKARLRLAAQIAETYRQHLDACNASCRTSTVNDGGGGAARDTPTRIEPPSLAPRDTPTTVEPPILPPVEAPKCSPCEKAAEDARAAQRELSAEEAWLDRMLAQHAQVVELVKSGAGSAVLDKSKAALIELERQLIAQNQTVLQKRAEVARADAALKACNGSCGTNTSEVPPPSPRTEPAVAPAPVEAPKPVDTSRWVESWTNCVAANTCPPIETDGGVPGNFPYPTGLPYVNVTDGGPWTTSGNVGIEINIQVKLVDVIDPISYPDYARLMTVSQNVSSSGVWPVLPSDARQLWIPPTVRQGVEKWFNPLGLLARRLIDNIERWRGSLGPRPLIRSSDLESIDRVSNVQAAGVPSGVHILLTDRGGSTGKTLMMQILNLTGAPVALSSRSFAVQPIQQQAQQRVQQAFNRLSQAAPVRLDLSAYCVEFLKQPPTPNTLFRLAPADVQQKYAAMSKVLQSAYRVSKGNGLHPDSNPAAYTDAMKQWAVWAVEQKYNEQRFTEAFLGHTKKNVEAAGQQWSKPAEETIRKASPNRWRDIVRILQGAGVAAPQ